MTSRPDHRRDVVVVGAGLAGGSLAYTLALRGWDVLLVERDTFPRHKVCGEFLSPESQATLRALGLFEAVAALGPTPIGTARLTARSGRALRVELGGEAWGLPRYALDAALARAAAEAGAEVLTGVSATRFETNDIGGLVQLRGQQGAQSVHARAVVLACGRHPARALRAAPERQPGPGVGVKCHLAGVAATGEVELFLFDGGYAGLAPVGEGLHNLCMLVSREAFRRAGGYPRGLIEAAQAWNPELARRIGGGRALAETLTSVAPVDTGDPLAPWGGAARLGDAAVMIPPLCGDGMAMALRSAELCAPLADAMLGGRATLQGWEAAYRRAWLREFAPRVRAARALQSALVAPALAELCLWAGGLVPALARTMVRATRGGYARTPRQASRQADGAL